MTEYGITPSGFVRKTLAEIKRELENQYRYAFGQEINLSTVTVEGQEIGILAEHMALLWELAEAVYHSAYLSTAEGICLDNLAELAGITRIPAAYSTLADDGIIDRRALVKGTPGVIIPAGKRASVYGTRRIFETTEEVEIGSGGVASVTMRAVETGPIEAPAGTLTVIETPISGWDEINNPLDAIPGRPAETDDELRIRIKNSNQIAGSGTVNSISARLINDIKDCSMATVLENDTDHYDINGLPPHSIAVVVFGGADNDIAHKIWELKGAGIGTHGNITIPVKDSMGYYHNVSFSRAENVPIWMHIQIRVDGNFNIGRAQRERIRITSIEPNTEYFIIINGNKFSYVSDNSPNIYKIISGLTNAVNAGAYVPVTAINMSYEAIDLLADYRGNPFNALVSNNLSLTTLVSNAGDQAAIIDAVVDYSRGEQIIGRSVYLSRYTTPINQASNNITSISITATKKLTSAPPYGTNNIQILWNEKAVFDSTRVTIEVI